MAAGLFGGTGTEIIDYLIKLAPAASIVGGIFAARAQLRNNRRINAEMIAKNHYRELLDAFLKNTDIVYLGLNPASFAELKQDIPTDGSSRFRSIARYSSCIGEGHKREKNWEHTIRVFISLFKNFILSPEDYTSYLQQALTLGFRAFVMDTARDFEHTSARTSLAQYLRDGSRG